MAIHLLYLNLWGTTAKLNEGVELGPPSDVAVCQRHFKATLAALALEHPTFSIAQLADEAYVSGPDLEELLSFAAEMFTRMLGDAGAFRFWPLRGAIGLLHAPFVIESSENFRSVAIEGDEAVEIARLEKSAQKGARLFLQAELRARLGLEAPVLPRSTRGFEHFEVNWLRLAREGNALIPRLRAKAEELYELDTNYSQQMAGSLIELVRWAEI